ncbi:MAG: WecB/TagA/CpsF family glycosyltransferase [Deltaproteobacteria bacterium]|nr:WecB/TagA/CpsF family glycosyltransferase [Deltaproteobacteria bacterium]
MKRCVESTVHILGVRIDNLTMEEALARILERVAEKRATQVSFVNADCLNIASRDPAYRAALAKSDLVFPDGSGCRLAGSVLGSPVRDNVNGTDLFPLLLDRLRPVRARIFLLGARPGVAEIVAEWIRSRHPELTVVGAEHGYFDAREEPAIADRIRSSHADVLLVAFGVPRQELWIQKLLSGEQTCVALGVGGLFDFFSGRIPRAPAWLRSLGLEWTYRLAQEPRRMWRRYLIGNFTFMSRVLAERAGLSKFDAKR